MLPDFTPYGYQVIDCLNKNVQGGRNTYKAINLNSQQTVVIKQFTFAKTSDWDSYKQIEREIDVLRGLKHRGIPKYLTKFDSDNGICLVQEYKKADPLSKTRSFSPEEIKSIANQVLEILVYLQTQIPTIIHRDLKPENILVDDEINVYVVDFGFARIGNKTMAFSSMTGGTLGFMPPEQIHNQKLTEASDLYGLGATLICLITQTKSADIGELVNFSTNRIDFKDKVPKFSFKFIQWLEKMVEPDPVNRFPSAKEALKALQPLYVMRVPEVNLDKLELNFVAERINQKISQVITVTNNIPETILQGKWSVSSHPSDPPHTPDRHSWISFKPKEFRANHVKCEVRIDTSKLKADKNYKREIILTSNAKQENIDVKVKVKTALMKLNVPPQPPYQLLAFLGLISWTIPLILIYSFSLIMSFNQQVILPQEYDELNLIGKIIDILLNLHIENHNIFEAIEDAGFTGRIIGGLMGGFLIGAFWGFLAFLLNLINKIESNHWSNHKYSYDNILIQFGIFISRVSSFIILGSLSGLFLGVIFGFIFGNIFTFLLLLISFDESSEFYSLEDIFSNLEYKYFHKRGFISREIDFYVLTTTLVGVFTGIGIADSFNSIVKLGLLISGLPLAVGLIYPPLKLWRLKVEYRRKESQNLIEP